MKILCVHQGYELYGSDRTFVQSVRAFREAYPRAHITVMLPKKGSINSHLEGLANDIVYEPLWVLRKSEIRSFGWRSLVELWIAVFEARRLMAKNDFTYLNTAVVLNFVIASFFTRAKRTIHVHEIPTGISRFVFSLLLVWSRAPLVFNSRPTRDAYWLMPWQNKKIVLNGVSQVATDPIVENDRGFINILMIGRINAWKGQGLLLAALDLMSAEQQSKIRLKIVGDVFEEQHHFLQNLEARVHEYGLQNIVDFHSFVDEPSVFYRWADVVVVPSTKPEPFGLVAIEAMAYRKMVVASSHGGIVDIVREGESGLLFKPGDAKSLCAVLAELVNDSSLPKRMGANGYQRFIDYFSEERYLHEIGNLLT